ncbi:hypothetical protein SEA_SONALI_6 [Arthrobacter phage Sonali]|uniref:Uncharacterized protein n=1 Tax=Arthrobacter phage Sonali TaxID=2510495 RepID=A0A411CQB6_9CAUD|nr:hypothetical protein HOV09_gp06 [Arthrobacter phage Sonali]QAY16119.1 hypothetical protein SEA_SONALI_6 [Arthrobacter phage Sonali]
MSVELVNPEIDRVDAVNGPATGIPFLLFKSAEGGPAVEPAETPEGEAVEKAADAPATGETPEAEETVEKAAEPAQEAAPEAPEAPVEKSEEPAKPGVLDTAVVLKSLVFDLHKEKEVRKAGQVALPTGLLELLGEVVAAYQQVVETGDQAPESPADAEVGAAPAGTAEAMDEAAAPVEDELVEDAQAPADEAPAEAPAPPAPAEAPAAPPAAPEEEQKSAAPPAPPAKEEAPAAPPAPAKAPAPAPAPAAPAAPAPAPAEDEKKKAPAGFQKSLEEAILEAVTKATAPLLEANQELTKRLEKVEATPVDSGPYLAGQTPGNAGLASLRGQDVGGAAVGLQKSAAPQPPSGMEALAAGLLNTWTGQ